MEQITKERGDLCITWLSKYAYFCSARLSRAEKVRASLLWWLAGQRCMLKAAVIHIRYVVNFI